MVHLFEAKIMQLRAETGKKYKKSRRKIWSRQQNKQSLIIWLVGTIDDASSTISQREYKPVWQHGVQN